ncbi:hypothetical protein BC834DRAFT_831142 [Gloeopeniophorella convolvens]|nr:hypothetical protein BC834DRAFT_836139 [Gloeopeniophorella convolvens]KAI0260801.1 hypothetical protein BC834DRAFT_831142 [Gloeopeniophorella convolvens]
MAIDNDMAALIGFGCEAFCYGCYTILFIVSTVLMLKRAREKGRSNMPITIASVFLYLLCTAHFGLEFNHFYKVLATTGVSGFANETNVLVGADILISIADFVGEMILIYRCWLLWSRNYWIIVVPILSAIAGVVCIAETVHLLLSVNPSSPIVPSSLVPLGLAGWTLPLCTNVIVTGLIAIRIWYLSPASNRDLRGVHLSSGAGRAAFDIIIESGALYLVVQLIFVVLFAIHHPAQGILAVVAVQIYGIAPTLILIRVALGLSNTSSRRYGRGGGAMTWSQPAPTQVRIGYTTTAFTDAGQGLAPEIAMPQLKTAGEDRRSSYSSVKDVV